MNREHHYEITVAWTGNTGTGTSHYRAYSRDHQISAGAKCAPISGSSDPAFRGDPARYNPEELLVAALSACHMLWFLHLCADAGIVVTDYQDAATGNVVEHADGAGEFTGVTLHPRVSITDPARIADANALHDQAHGFCVLARSVKFPVDHAPVTFLKAESPSAQ